MPQRSVGLLPVLLPSGGTSEKCIPWTDSRSLEVDLMGEDRENAEGLRRMQNPSDSLFRGDDSLNDVAPDEKSSTRPRKPEAPKRVVWI